MESAWPILEVVFGPVAARRGMTLRDLMEKIAQGLEAHVNRGKLPPGSTPGPDDLDFGPAFHMTKFGRQLEFCVSEESLEIKIVGAA